MFDIFLACAPKDYNKLPHVVDSIVKNIEGYDNLILCSPTTIPPEILERIPVMFYTFLDDAGLPGVDRSLWRHRPNWCFQQHLKLFQKVTRDWYLTFDCDTIVNRSMKFFENEKPMYWKGIDQFHRPYFKFMTDMLDLEKVEGTTSYIADMNLIYRPIIEEMLKRHNYTRESFIRKSQEITDKGCYIGEPELYGNYCAKHHPDMYVEKLLKQAHFEGRLQNDVNKQSWNEEEIKARIEENKSRDIDTFSIHSWLVEGDA